MLSKRAIRIKELIHDQVNMGTYGMVELELIDYDKEVNKNQIELTDEEIEIIAVNLTKNKYGAWYHNGDDSTAYYKGIIDGIYSVIKRKK